MSWRIAKINKHLQRTFGEILQQEADLPADVLVTISRVDTTPNLQAATVWLYIFPLEHATAVLESLKHQLYHLQGVLNRQLQLKPLPRLVLKIDSGAAYAETIEQKLSQLHNKQPGR